MHNKSLKGPVSTKNELIPGTRKCYNPDTSILLLKPWNSICSRRYRTRNLSGGAAFSATCGCVYNQENMCLFHLYS